jgi:hypothetical protein
MMVHYTTLKHINCILHKTVNFSTKLLLYLGYIWVYNIEHTWLNSNNFNLKVKVVRLGYLHYSVHWNFLS